MSAKRGGPKWKVLRRHPKAYAIQLRNGNWRVLTREAGSKCIGEGHGFRAAWDDAWQRIRNPKE